MWSLLLLVIVANSAPVVLADLLGARGAWPIDGGLELRDGQPLFGRAKTWRGLCAAGVATAAFAPALDLAWTTGLAAGALAMAGDLLASFCKRRLGIASSGRAPVLDSVPEALLPALGLRSTLALDWLEVAGVAVLFSVAVSFLSPLLYRLHIRARPW